VGLLLFSAIVGDEASHRAHSREWALLIFGTGNPLGEPSTARWWRRLASPLQQCASRSLETFVRPVPCCVRRSFRELQHVVRRSSVNRGTPCLVRRRDPHRRDLDRLAMHDITKPTWRQHIAKTRTTGRSRT